MNTRAGLVVFVIAVFIAACGSRAVSDTGSNVGGQGSNNRMAAVADGAAGDAAKKVEPAAGVQGEPRTVRDFFMLLPEKYFGLEGCERDKDKDCRKARLDYLKTFTDVEDTANGYLKGGCDGAQSCLTMTIFKRPDASYLVAVMTEAEMMTEQYFLDYKNGQWTDVSADVIPQFSKKNIYELPRQGTTVKVFAKKVIEKGDDYEVSEKGAKLYDLVWKDGRFSIRK